MHIYVDDIIIVCSELAHICKITQKLRDRCNMSDMGTLEHFLNVSITSTSSYIQLDRSVCSQKVLDTLSTCLGARTKPMVGNIKSNNISIPPK